MEKMNRINLMCKYQKNLRKLIDIMTIVFGVVFVITAVWDIRASETIPVQWVYFIIVVTLLPGVLALTYMVIKFATKKVIICTLKQIVENVLDNNDEVTVQKILVYEEDDAVIYNVILDGDIEEQTKSQMSLHLQKVKQLIQSAVTKNVDIYFDEDWIA